MSEQEFERLARRFGEDVSAWPAPYRQEGLAYLAGEEALDADASLDRLILGAVDAGADDAALTRKVMLRINAAPEAGILAGVMRLFTPTPMAASAFAALLLVAAVGGYVAAGDGTRGLDDALMAFALGDNAGESGDLLGEFDAEEQL